MNIEAKSKIASQIAVMQAFFDGKPIQIKTNSNEWSTIADPSWDWSHNEYRISPPKPCEIYVWEREGKYSLISGHPVFMTEKPLTENCPASGWKVIKFKEVLE